FRGRWAPPSVPIPSPALRLAPAPPHASGRGTRASLTHANMLRQLRRGLFARLSLPLQGPNGSTDTATPGCPTWAVPILVPKHAHLPFGTRILEVDAARHAPRQLSNLAGSHPDHRDSRRCKLPMRPIPATAFR